jgi:hypothetical protein
MNIYNENNQEKKFNGIFAQQYISANIATALIDLQHPLLAP